MAFANKYTDIIVTVKDGIGTIKVRREPWRLFGESFWLTAVSF